jgi:hypothetical protein
VKWASAIEDLMKSHSSDLDETMSKNQLHETARETVTLGRFPPLFNDHLRKNIPIEYGWRYEGGPQFHVSELRLTREGE